MAYEGYEGDNSGVDYSTRGSNANATASNLLPIPGMAGAMYDPATGQMYDVNGQQVNGHYDPASQTFTDPTGATRHVTGTGAPPTATTPFSVYSEPVGGPATTTGGGGGGGGGGSTDTAGTGGAPTPFAWPTYTPPTAPTFTNLQAPQPYTFTPFSYDKFSAPTLAEAQAQPGYQFGLEQGQGALLNAAARMGVARGGGTLKDLFNYTNAAAEQNYGNVFNQDLTGYTTNRDTAFNSWAANNAAALNAYGTNYGVAKDVNASANTNAQNAYSNARQNAADVFNPQFEASKLSFSDMYNRWLAKLNSLTNIATAGAS